MAKTKSVKLDTGTVYPRGNKYYFRFQLNGQRKDIPLKTGELKEAVEKARELVPVVVASSVEVVAAHVNHAKGWAKQQKRLELDKAWDTYDTHPDRARPRTENIYLIYKSYFAHFAAWATNQNINFLDEATDRVASEYADFLRQTPIGVDTHNKRIRRTGHVFRTLKDYTSEKTSTWQNASLRRKPREETGIEARRMPFSKEQEEAIFQVLDDSTRKFGNKRELTVLFCMGAFTGQRMKDCTLLQWHNVDLERQRVKVVQFKTGKPVSIPIASQLMKALKEAADWKSNSYVLPLLAERYQRKNAKGKDVGSNLVNKDVMRIIEAAGIEPSAEVTGRKKRVTVFGFHSLRHSFAAMCIDNNIPKAVAVSILGADSDILDRYYTHIGEEAQEQALLAISGDGSTLRQRFDRAIEYLTNLGILTPELKKLQEILAGK
jgi:integrase